MRKQLNSRDEKILLSLKHFDFLTRDQLNQYCKLGTVRNTNRVLLELSEYLMSVRSGYMNIYYLSRRGREYVGCEKIRKKGGHVEHTVMRNQLWLYYGCPSDWKNEVKVSDGDTTLVCDAMFKNSIQRHFLEVDHLQSMKKNREKIKKYTKLYQKGLIAEALGEFPVLVWLTTTDLRKKQLLEACNSLPIVRVFTINDIK